MLTSDSLWYKDAIFYELHVKAFSDSNDDGIGDFRGLTSKLDYLEWLGITCIWLLPFFPSPLKDDGYDVYSSSQGFLKYDLPSKTASAPFSHYKDIENSLYTELFNKTGRRAEIKNKAFNVQG